MSLKKIVYPLALLLIIFMAGCGAYISPDLIYKLQDDVRDVKKDVSELKGDQDRQGALGREMGIGGSAKSGDVELELRKEIASIKADIERLRGEISTFQGFIDETKYQMQQDQLATVEKIKESEGRLLALEAKMETLMGPKFQSETYDREGQIPEQKAPEQAGTGEREKESIFTSEREIPPPRQAAVQSPENLYDYGLGLIKANKFGEARKSLDEFAKTYPDHRLLPNVFYWRGETFYAEKDFESAAITFQEVIDRFPESPKAPDALYKQGMCFYNMKDSVSAKAAFNLLLSKYPASIAAGKAKLKLNELNQKGG
ncbi:MAG: tol-pal system protein YbgF [Deltaproteobacteria bacterium]|nr:tol-pal system protein YbgF [Deltaproteobacteria bacterium]